MTLVAGRKRVPKPATGKTAFLMGLIVRTDEYLGEYVPETAERLAYVTGFTGSAGVTVITHNKAVVMSDGRYTIQLEQEVDGEVFDTANSQEVTLSSWIKDNSEAGDMIGYDPKLHTPAEIDDKPAAPMTPVTLYPEKFAGRSLANKKEALQKKIKDENCMACLLTMSDSIAWLLNIRGNDIQFIPVCLSYALVPVSGNDKRDKIWLDEKRTPIYFKNILQQSGAEILNKEDPCLLPRACKNEAEIKAMKQAHRRDGAAFVKFEKWLQENWQGQTELSVEAKLQEFRAQASEFKEPSFSTIAGYGAHGAIVHYRATEKSDVEIDYTLVLKGHIALASAVFKKGTTGIEIDKLARQFLLEKGKNYAHGTGHGVGCYLSVHEESASISPRSERPLEAGMILSNEPGFYKEDAYGIRIENLVLVKEHDENNLCFETITLAPIETMLIDKSMLDEAEIKWLNDYHEKVEDSLKSLLNFDYDFERFNL